MLQHLSLPIPNESDIVTSDEKNFFSLITTGKDVPFSKSKYDDSSSVTERVIQSLKDTYSHHLSSKWNMAFLKNTSQILELIRHTLGFADETQITASDKTFWISMQQLINRALDMIKIKSDMDINEKHPLNGFIWFTKVHFGGKTALEPSLWQKAFPDGKYKEFGVILYYMLVRQFFGQFLESIELLGVVFTVLMSYTRIGSPDLALYFPEVWKRSQIDRNSKVTNISRSMRSFIDYYNSMKQRKNSTEDLKAIRTLKFNSSKIPLFFVFLDETPENLFDFVYIESQPRASISGIKKYWQRTLIIPPAIVGHSNEMLAKLTPNDFSLKQMWKLLEEDHMSNGTIIGPFWTNDDIEKAYHREQATAAPAIAAPATNNKPIEVMSSPTKPKTKSESIEEVLSSLKMITIGRHQVFEEKVDGFIDGIKKQIREIQEKSSNVNEIVQGHEKLIGDLRSSLSSQLKGVQETSDANLKIITEKRLPAILDDIKVLTDEKETKENVQKLVDKIKDEIKKLPIDERVQTFADKAKEGLEIVKKEVGEIQVSFTDKISKLTEEINNLKETVSSQGKTIEDYKRQIASFKDSVIGMAKSHESLESVIKKLPQSRAMSEEEEKSLLEEFNRLSTELSGLIQNYDQ